MKTNTAAYLIMFKAMDDAIAHSHSQGLPLTSIELDQEEWNRFILAFLEERVARSLLGKPSDGRTITHTTDDILLGDKAGQLYYRGIKIYREKTR